MCYSLHRSLERIHRPMKVSFCVFAVCLALWLTGSVSFAGSFRGRVVEIADGDTLSVMTVLAFRPNSDLPGRMPTSKQTAWHEW